MADRVAVERVVPYEPAHQLFGVGIEQKLIVVEAMAAFGIVRAVNAKAVELSRSQIGKITVPFLIRVLRQCDTGRLALPLLVEQAQFYALGVLRENRDVDSLPVPGGPKGMRVARPHARAKFRRAFERPKRMLRRRCRCLLLAV